MATTYTIQLKRGRAASWIAQNPILAPGEPGFEIDTGRQKIGNGVSHWVDLPYVGEDGSGVVNKPTPQDFPSVGDVNLIYKAEKENKLYSWNATSQSYEPICEEVPQTSVYETILESEETHEQALTRIVNGAELHSGDIGIVKVLVAAEKYGYTAYVYDGAEWKAMDGNYNAKNVYLDSDLTITADVGVQKLEGEGSKILETSGKNLKQVFDMLFAARALPTYVEPSVSVSSPQVGEYEVGTTITVSYSTDFNAGSYAYGPDNTGVLVEKWSVSFNNEILDTAAGSFSPTVITDGFDKTVAATAQYGAGAAPYDNLGNIVEDASELAKCQIAAGSVSKATTAIKGYRNLFYTSETTPIELTSENIRGLSKKKSSTNSFEMAIVEGAKQVIVAVPEGRKVVEIADKAAFGTNIAERFVDTLVSIAGAVPGYEKNYHVYVYSPSVALGANTYTISIANE